MKTFITIFSVIEDSEEEIINENRFICQNTDFEISFDGRDVEEDKTYFAKGR